MSHIALLPGRAYSFFYPRHNYRQLPKNTELRRIVVASVRDLNHDPLDETTEPLNPLLQRSRWLVTGRDLDKDAERSFYLDSMSEIQLLEDEDLEPLKDAEYVVIEQSHVRFKARTLNQALAYRAGREGGTVCGVLFRKPRKLPDVSILDEPLPDDAFDVDEDQQLVA